MSRANLPSLQAVIFDLDGVITDTAEFHYLAWKKLADEEGLPFDRTVNEKLRGISRRESLLIILDGRSRSEAEMQAMMTRKNSYYQDMLHQISPADLLPGVVDVLDELDVAGIPYAIASASRNAAFVVEKLGIAGRLAVLADGRSVLQTKPAPDLFRFAAAKLDTPPGACLVIEDAAAGVQAALTAGMMVLALGPAARFDALPLWPYCRPTLEGITLAELREITAVDPQWTITQTEFDQAGQHHMETVFYLRERLLQHARHVRGRVSRRQSHHFRPRHLRRYAGKFYGTGKYARLAGHHHLGRRCAVPPGSGRSIAFLSPDGFTPGPAAPRRALARAIRGRR